MKNISLIFVILGLSLTGFCNQKKSTSHASNLHPYLMDNYSSSNEDEIQTAFSTGSYVTDRVGTNNLTVLTVMGSWARFVKPKIQAGGEIKFISASGAGSSSSNFDVVGFGTYNFDDDIHNSFYAKGGLGLFAIPPASGNGFENKFGFMVAGGKRFPLWERIQYSPEVRIYKKGDLDMYVDIYFLNLSLMF
jgi:hypothetical protein